MANPNLCEKCIGDQRPEPQPKFELADTGVCGSCGNVDEVWDLPHLSALRVEGKSVYAADGFTTRHDRLRDSHLD